MLNTGPASQPGVNRALLAGILDLQKQVADLTRQLQEMPSLAYRGVWSEGEQYQPGNFVTHSGSIWHANEPTTTRPGSGPAWQLAVKKGKDGR